MVVYLEWLAEQLGTEVPEYNDEVRACPIDWVGSHCVWRHTPQGHAAWQEIDGLWREVVRTQEVVFSRPRCTMKKVLARIATAKLKYAGSDELAVSVDTLAQLHAHILELEHKEKRIAEVLRKRDAQIAELRYQIPPKLPTL